MWYYYCFVGDLGIVVCGPYMERATRDKDAEGQSSVDDVVTLIEVDPSDGELTMESME